MVASIKTQRAGSAIASTDANNKGYKEALVTFGVAAAADTSTFIGIGICVMIEKPH
jgi:hypothetical protein